MWHGEDDEDMGLQGIRRLPRCGEKEIMAHILSCKDKSIVWGFHDLVEMMDAWKVKADTILGV